MLTLNLTEAGDHDQRLSERMRVPRRPGARLKVTWAPCPTQEVSEVARRLVRRRAPGALVKPARQVGDLLVGREVADGPAEGATRGPARSRCREAGRRSPDRRNGTGGAWQVLRPGRGRCAAA